MTQRERQILSLLKSFLNDEISFDKLDSQWINLYCEDEENTEFVFEETLSEIGEFIFMGSNMEPSPEEKLEGVLGPEVLREKISLELNKNPNWEKFAKENELY